MDYCYKILNVIDFNADIAVKYYVKDREEDVFVECNIEIPIKSDGTIVNQEDLHLYISNGVPKRTLLKKIACIDDKSNIQSLSTLTNIEYNISVV